MGYSSVPQLNGGTNGLPGVGSYNGLYIVRDRFGTPHVYRSVRP
jgi:hypothetical protein